MNLVAKQKARASKWQHIKANLTNINAQNADIWAKHPSRMDPVQRVAYIATMGIEPARLAFTDPAARF